MKGLRLLPLLLILLASLFLSVGGSIYVYRERIAHSSLREEFWLEVEKAFLQLFIISCLSGVTAFAFKSWEKTKRLERTIHEFRHTFLRSLEDIYLNVKQIRRHFRMLYANSAESSLVNERKYYDTETIRELVLQLSRHQLELERLISLCNDFPDSFNNKKEIVATITTLEKYLHDVVAGSLAPWPEAGDGSQFRGFFEKRLSQVFVESFGKPMDLCRRMVRSELLSLRAAKSEY